MLLAGGAVVLTMLLAIGWWALAQLTPPDRFNSERAWADLMAQCELGPRPPGSEAHAKCILYIKTKLEESGATITTQPFNMKLEGRLVPSRNIIGRFGPVEGKARLLLGAHFDTRPWADLDLDQANHSKPILGANDGASGVAVLLELARFLKANPQPFAVDLAFFDAEDAGRNIYDFCQGSFHYAFNSKTELPEQAIILDMIGDTNLGIQQEGYSQTSAPRLQAAVWQAARRAGAKHFLSGSWGEIYDDHRPLQLAGVEAIDIIDFDYPQWHTMDDKPEACSAASLDEVGETVLEYLTSLSR